MLCALPIVYRYRYCPSCRREWPADCVSCRECRRWLGDNPLERTEWQIAPPSGSSRSAEYYEVVGASIVVLRLVSAQPSEPMLKRMTSALHEIFLPETGAACSVAGFGWLVWRTDGLRRAFLGALEIEKRLSATLPEIGKALGYTRFRWGIWIDQYVLPFVRSGPVVSAKPARAIFNFEPDDNLLGSEAVYEANRRWEHFVCVPRRLLSGKEEYGYSFLGRKRPSALDHAKAIDARPLLGRDRELVRLDKSRRSSSRLALIAPAGAGKTRLIREWLRRHPKLRALLGNFSVFGGDLVSFASQLAELPVDRLDEEALLSAVLNHIEAARVDVVVVDDIHWAGPEGADFVRRLLAALPPRVFAVLASRPVGLPLVEKLSPETVLRLEPLATREIGALARALTPQEAVAMTAAARSGGNPLFVEQFAGWAAETGWQGGEDGPRNLHQVVAARIAHLAEDRVMQLRQQLRWGGAWQRQTVRDELDRVEAEIGLWLDRLETGDYADRVDTAHHLFELEQIAFELFVLSTLAGRPHPRSNRLREAIDRLLIGSGEQILADLAVQARTGTDADRQTVCGKAVCAGDCARAAFAWPLAAHFYALARDTAPPWRREEIEPRFAECWRRAQASPEAAAEAMRRSAAAWRDPEENPAVDTMSLPDVWAGLATRHRCRAYFLRAAEAAEAIRDKGFGAWARSKAAEFCRTAEVEPRS